MPWLLAAAIGGLLVAVALSGFEGALATVPILALFMPVIAGMGGNVGTQSSTIVVRGLAVGYVESASVGRLVIREMSLGLMLGAIYGLLIALVAPFIGARVDDPVALGAVLTLGMMGSMTIAATVGTSIPLLMNRFKIDPAVSTGPFVTTAVDILGLLFYFWLATVLLGVEP
jgi:magnesium transporter